MLTWPISLWMVTRSTPPCEASGKGVAQRVNTATLGDARAITGTPISALGGLDTQRPYTATRAKEPVARLGPAYVGSQEFQQRG